MDVVRPLAGRAAYGATPRAARPHGQLGAIRHTVNSDVIGFLIFILIGATEWNKSAKMTIK